MKITWSDLTIDPQGLDAASLLDEWRWLVPRHLEPVVISALGDLFLQDQQGRIFWLDTGWGQLTEVARDFEDFEKQLQDHETATEWFIPQLVGDLMAKGKELGQGQCFGFVVPPVLGGEIALDNFEPIDVAVHVGVLGQIHRQVKDLPPGTPIGKIEIGGPEA